MEKKGFTARSLWFLFYGLMENTDPRRRGFLATNIMNSIDKENGHRELFLMRAANLNWEKNHIPTLWEGLDFKPEDMTRIQQYVMDQFKSPGLHAMISCLLGLPGTVISVGGAAAGVVDGNEDQNNDRTIRWSGSSDTLEILYGSRNAGNEDK
ncbi:Protein of unknown function [Pyronema omphalodes CBS 100304]|uniref:Uncharacterized protein n=1 Tax=Pyronema omphalodes (strain CBS 100304) TaxID=1076935 RepID=U4L7A0_PYROM|nr:Protein of unknown function [Pyronema omphalodes CBS 100304]